MKLMEHREALLRLFQSCMPLPSFHLFDMSLGDAKAPFKLAITNKSKRID